jgi:deazaflavin-dependent oxidoreductase (nitroreductase family)
VFWKTWNFQQKPTGMWKRMLRIPVFLFRWRLGFLMGERILLLTHIGRASGRVYQTPIEVVEHDRSTREYIVCSGTGPQADWYRNLLTHPAPQIQVKNQRWQPVQRLLSPNEAASRFARYERHHCRTSIMLLREMGNRYDGTDEGRLAMMAEMPMVAFVEPGHHGNASP